MTEMEMRNLVHGLLRKVIYPAAVGASLTLATGCGDTPKYGVPHVDQGTTTDSTGVKYGAPLDSGVDFQGVDALYAAPFDSGSDGEETTVKYGAPFDGSGDST